MQMMNVFLCRHPLEVVAVLRALQQPADLLLGIAAELGVILFIVYTPAGNWLFGTAPVGAEVWLLAAGLRGADVGAEEARKAWLRRAPPHGIGLNVGPVRRARRMRRT